MPAFCAAFTNSKALNILPWSVSATAGIPSFGLWHHILMGAAPSKQRILSGSEDVRIQA
ncbi:MAG: hypothetical protein IPL35_17625 [Sphingobacteriales bacterium]|nr:hypothetical protein [Sphingobacteriales bacterium]